MRTRKSPPRELRRASFDFDLTADQHPASDYDLGPSVALPVPEMVARRRHHVGHRTAGGSAGLGQLLRGQRVGQAGQRIGAGGEAGFGEDLVDDRLERRDRQQLRGKAVAEAKPPLPWPFMAPLPPPRPSRPPVSKIRMSEIFSIGLTASASAFGMMLMRARIEIVVDHFRLSLLRASALSAATSASA
jgi:hypothetical protein